MVTCSLSNALWEIPTSAVYWPATTKPWFSGTMVVGRGTAKAHLHSFQADSGTDLADHLRAAPGEPVHIVVGVPCIDGWDVRFATDILVGQFGSAAVVVVRDSEGKEFCPDVPQLAVTSLREVVAVASVIVGQRPSQPTPLRSLAMSLN